MGSTEAARLAGTATARKDQHLDTPMTSPRPAMMFQM